MGGGGAFQYRAGLGVGFSSGMMAEAMDCEPRGGERINSFALVSYLPGDLGSFLDRLRTELVSSCVARSHVTILPPRELSATEESARRQIAECVPDFPPFRIELGEVAIFPMTQVVYLELRFGTAALRGLHDALNTEALGFNEPFDYHPHVTLAQGLLPEDVPAAYELARERWSEFSRARSYEVDRLTFVQNTTANRWLDLMEYELGSMAGVRSR